MNHFHFTHHIDNWCIPKHSSQCLIPNASYNISTGGCIKTAPIANDNGKSKACGKQHRPICIQEDTRDSTDITQNVDTTTQKTGTTSSPSTAFTTLPCVKYPLYLSFHPTTVFKALPLALSRCYTLVQIQVQTITHWFVILRSKVQHALPMRGCRVLLS